MKRIKAISIIVLLVGTILLSSCTKDKVTTIVAKLHNKSGVKINFTPYKGGVVVSDKSFTLNDNDSFQIAFESEMGDIKMWGFSSEYISGMDSIIITFDSIYKISHYSNETTATSLKHYQPSNPRNIFVGSNYEFVMKREGEMTNLHYYTFTESDYEFAKD